MISELKYACESVLFLLKLQVTLTKFRSATLLKLNFFIGISLREKCPYSELFWSAFSRMTTITPNTDTLYAAFFKDFDHTISLIHCRTALFKIIYFPQLLLQWLLLFIHWIPLINTHFFSYWNLYANAKSCQINWKIERTITCGSIFFCKDKILQR